MGTLHCALENGADLYVNERHTTLSRGLLKKEERRRRRMPIRDFLLVRKLALYNSDVIHSFDWKSAMEHDGGV